MKLVCAAGSLSNCQCDRVHPRVRGACLRGYGGDVGRALTLVRCVKPGNVDAVNLVHGRVEMVDTSDMVKWARSSVRVEIEQQLCLLVLSSWWWWKWSPSIAGGPHG
jgi:hypothetical protein